MLFAFYFIPFVYFKGQQYFSVKGQIVEIFWFMGHRVSVTILNCAAVTWKQLMSVAVLQQNFTYKTGSGLDLAHRP